MIRKVGQWRSWYLSVLAVILAGVIVGVGGGDAAADRDDWGAVFTLTNEPDGNQLAVYERDRRGRLAPAYFVPTGGLGTGGGLGNQGALALSDDADFLYAVNPGSDTVTVFRLSQRGPRAVQVIASQGQRPISLTARGDLLFVLNAGGAVGGVDSIAGFTIGGGGRLHPLPRSVRQLSADDTAPAQVGFNPSGDALVVTEKDTNLITTFAVNRRGIPSAPKFQASAGMTPFGFEFNRDGILVVSEAFGGEEDASAVSSYALDRAATAAVLSPSVGTTETAACWIAITRNGRYVYTTNTGSDSVSGYALSGEGKLALLDEDGVTAETGDSPTDLAALGNRALYVLNRNDGTVGVYAIDDDGSLKPLQLIGGLPLTRPTGLVVR